ncbi:MAG: hypothetical protein ACK4UY_09055 [Dietzia sp.]
MMLYVLADSGGTSDHWWAQPLATILAAAGVIGAALIAYRSAKLKTKIDAHGLRVDAVIAYVAATRRLTNAATFLASVPRKEDPALFRSAWENYTHAHGAYFENLARTRSLVDNRGLFLAINSADRVVIESVSLVVNDSEPEADKKADELLARLTEVENLNQVYANGARCIPLNTPVN